MSEGTGPRGMTTPIVCFDWGGVILRICSGWDEARARSGLAHREIPCDAAMRARRHALLRAYETGRIACDAFFEGVSVEMARAFSPGEIRRVHDAWLIEEYRGARELIEELREHGVETALLSNTNQRHWQRHMGFDGMPGDFPAISLLAHRCASHLLGHAKPDQAIFLAARAMFEAAGRTPHAARDVLFFDDREENVLAARRAGWHARLVDPASDPPGQVRRALIESGVL